MFVKSLASLAILASSAVAFNIESSILSQIAAQPNLTTFAALIKATGPVGRASPDFEERFNNPTDETPYTVFAPSNEAFAKINPVVLKTLQEPYSYDLLLALIRTHITWGKFNSTTLASATPLRAVEGFNLTVNMKTAPPRLLKQANIIATDIPAKNGVIHVVDTILDPFLDYFKFSDARGTIVPGPPVAIPGAPPQEPAKQPAYEQQDAYKPSNYVEDQTSGKSESTKKPVDTRMNAAWRTMTDIVKFYPQLSNASALLEAIDPSFLNDKLSNYLDSEGYAMAHYFIPSNAAFAVLPRGGHAALYAPSNRGLATYLLEYGYTTQKVEPSTVRLTRDQTMVQSQNGLEITLVSMRGSTRVQNAVVEGEPLCTRNGCVWIVDRLLDPVLGKFGTQLL